MSRRTVYREPVVPARAPVLGVHPSPLGYCTTTSMHGARCNEIATEVGPTGRYRCAACAASMRAHLAREADRG